jgi:hypothetical protein
MDVNQLHPSAVRFPGIDSVRLVQKHHSERCFIQWFVKQPQNDNTILIDEILGNAATSTGKPYA